MSTETNVKPQEGNIKTTSRSLLNIMSSTFFNNMQSFDPDNVLVSTQTYTVM